jgi:2-dehydropantoate 2-reductase
MPVMKIAVIGAGGVGGFFGGRLAKAGHDVTFIARGRTLEALRARGLRVESIEGDFDLNPIPATDDPAAVGPVDAVLIAVKAWQLPDAARAALPLLGPDTVVVPLQNGIDAPEQLRAILPETNVVGGLCAIVSFVVEPGHIRHAGAKPLVAFGELDGRSSSPRLEALKQAFADAGINVEIPPDIRRSMWTKLLFIAPVSAIGALTRVPIGAWRTHVETRALADAACREIIALAAARGTDLGADAVERTMERFDMLPPESTSSLQRDVMAGLPSELEAQIGAIVRMAREEGVPAPVMGTMYACLAPGARSAES